MTLRSKQSTMRRRLIVAFAVGLLVVLAGCTTYAVMVCSICEGEARNVYVDSNTTAVNESTATVTVSESGTVRWRVENDLDLAADEELRPTDEIERRAAERIEEPQTGSDGRYSDGVDNVSVTSLSRERAVITFTTDATAIVGPGDVVLYHGLSKDLDGRSINARTLTVRGPGDSVQLLGESDDGEIEDGTLRFDREDGSIHHQTIVIFAPDDGLTSQVATRLVLLDHYSEMVEFVAKVLAALTLGALAGVVLLAPRVETPMRKLAALELRDGRPVATGAVAALGLVGAGILASALSVGWAGVIGISVVAVGATLALSARLPPWSQRDGVALCLFGPLVPAALVAVLVWGATDPGARLVPSAGLLGTVLGTLSIGVMVAAGAAGLDSRWRLLGATLPPALFVYGYMLFWSSPMLAPLAGQGFLPAIFVAFVFFTTVGIAAFDAGRGFREEAIASADRGRSSSEQ